MSIRCKCKLISLGKINKYFLIIISASIFKIFQYDFSSNLKSLKNFDNINQILVYSLGLSLSIIIFFIYKGCNKSEKTKTNSIIISKRIKTFSKLKKFLWILLISVIDFISNIFELIINVDDAIISLSSWTINFIIMSLCSYCILKITLYKHHYLCIIIFFIICLFCNIIYFIIEDINSLLLFYLYTSFKTIFPSLTYVLFKYFLLKTYMKSFEIIYIQGLIELILSLILIIILIYSGAINNFEYIWNIFRKKSVLFLLSLFFNFAYYSQLYIIIDFFSPFHIFLVILIYYMIFIIIFGKGLLGITLCIFIICFGLICILVFTEIIELNCCGLSYMTKRNIALRAQLDNDLNEDDDNDPKSDKRIHMEGYIIELEKNMLTELNILDTNSSNEE